MKLFVRKQIIILRLFLVLLLGNQFVSGFTKPHGSALLGRAIYLKPKSSLHSFGVPSFQVNTGMGLTMSTTIATSAKPKLVEPFGRGLWKDIKGKLPHYKSDFTDGFNIKSLASIFFLFFACLSPAVAFGGLLGIATNGNMGTVEAVGATAIGGVLYALFSAQPLTIIGTTGPLLAFLKVLYDSCIANNLPFLVNLSILSNRLIEVILFTFIYIHFYLFSQYMPGLGCGHRFSCIYPHFFQLPMLLNTSLGLLTTYFPA